MKDLSDQIIDYNLHALHPFVFSINVSVCGVCEDICDTQQQGAEPGE